ncbi:DUF1735 domain-containing protein [Sphingobacterium bovistauri]|uniref:DUF1735 domain-containing protein n=1 Tax=Sphingobacterium bovistauri TaxID=2781959 RepID=A0ABS7Z478_9SPHI|nr:DUF1735 domain-containing protein [Sphingobacterium bovistauri]MCA5004347.1 DUF1735 domain-containing protein [Sphingobacterium bovistauri]
MKKIFSLSLITIFIFSLSSCLKDELVENQEYGLINLNANKFIGFEERSQVNSMTSEDKTLTIEVPVHLAAEEVAESDLVVNLAISNDESLRTAYNITNKSNIILFPTNLYTVDSYKITIPKGSKTGFFKMQLNPSKLNPADVYGLGITINSIEQNGYIISGNYGSTVSIFSVKNIYDGIYSMEDGFVQRYSAPGVPTTGDALNGSMKGNPNITLSSIDGTTVEVTNLRWAGGASGIAGIDNLRFRVNPANNLVTVFALGNASAANIPGAVNKYDPATKTFTLNFHWNPTANKREVTNLVIKYNKSR